MEPKIIEPLIRSFRCSAIFTLVLFSFDELRDAFHFSDSFKTKIYIMEMPRGSIPIIKPCCQPDTKKLTAPEEKIPTGKPIERIPINTARLFSGHVSDNNVVLITIIPPTPNPQINRKIITISHDVENPIRSVASPNIPTAIASDLTRPMRSPRNPQVNPPMAQPTKYSALINELT